MTLSKSYLPLHKSELYEKIYVGKIPNQPCVSQEKIEKVLDAKMEKSCSPKRSESDPYLVAEEERAQTLIQKVPFEVYQEYLSLLGGLAYAGIP